MSDVVRTKKVAHEVRPCVLMIFLPAGETQGNMHGTTDLPPLHLIVWEFVPIKAFFPLSLSFFIVFSDIKLTLNCFKDFHLPLPK